MSGSGAGVSSKPFRSFEVFTGVGRRRSFSTEEKLALVARRADCDNISELARRHDLRPSQLFTWRRELRYVEETGERYRVNMVPLHEVAAYSLATHGC